MSSAAQIAANQKNAQLSCGPSSPAGKAISSLNAVKTGLTGRTVLLPGDDAALYQEHVASFLRRYAPLGESEQHLVQSLADTQWRLLRIPALEWSIYALGRLEFAELFPDQDEKVRQHLIDGKTLLTYQRQLNNLSIQEGRLRRQHQKDMASLRELQEARRREDDSRPEQPRLDHNRLDEMARLYILFIQEAPDLEFDPAEFGFEFSLEQISARAFELNPAAFSKQEPKVTERPQKSTHANPKAA